MARDENPLSKVLMGVISARFGPGVIGRIGTISIAAFVVMTLISGIVAFQNVYAAVAIMFMVGLLAIYSIERAYRYADKHPHLSAMDGAQISRVLAQQVAMKALPGLPEPPEFSSVTTQNPLIEGAAEEAK